MVTEHYLKAPRPFLVYNFILSEKAPAGYGQIDYGVNTTHLNPVYNRGEYRRLKFTAHDGRWIYVE